MPTTTEITYITSTKSRFLFIFLVFLKSTTSPSPALEQSPPTRLPNITALLVYAPVKITLEAQLGISPISPVIKGWTYAPPSIALAEIFSTPPAISMIYPNTRLTIKRYAAILSACNSGEII